ncbi:MAG TPA: class I SAM-dependent methyltransferase [Saprospiraceae bacterium]|nr:class I SAM-dependent methyltransferase [Saprospiraceae bacterium]
MGSSEIQNRLWGQNPKDWADIQEPTGKSGYEHVLKLLKMEPGQTLLDVGCGTGYFSNMAYQQGIEVTGMDACEKFIEQANKRNPAIKFLRGEMEELPFPEDTFDAVCGFNSFQYAADMKNALLQAKKVLKNGGKFVVMIWGNKEDCEAASYLKAIGSLLPPPPPNAGGPFSLSENKLLENTLEEIGLTIIHNNDVPSVWEYPDTDIALKGLLSAGPAARAIENSGFEKVYETMKEAIKPHVLNDGRVEYHNKWRVVISQK